jgi:DNA-binding NtrC family response regulator
MIKYLAHFLEGKKRTSGDKLDALPTLDELKAEYIEYLLDCTFQNKTQTARILNISRTALYYRLAVTETGEKDSLFSLNGSKPESSH